MASGFRLLPAGLEEAQFERVAEGWLFTTSSPWVFAPRRTYLLTDAQKPAIAARVRRSRYIRVLLLVPILPILVAAFLLYPPLLNFHEVVSWLGFLAMAVFLAIVFSLSDYLSVRSLLRDIPRSSRKIRLRDMMRAQSQAMSVKALVIFTLIFVLGFAFNGYNALRLGQANPFATIGAIGLALLAIAFGLMLKAKLRNVQSENEAGLTTEQLAARISRVERGSIVQTLGLVALGGLAVIAAAMLGNLFDQSSDPSLRSLTLRNAKGEIVASMRAGTDGLPVFALLDGNNKVRAAIGLAKNGAPFFSLYDGDGKIRSTMTTLTSPDASKQNAILQLFDEKGKFRMWAGVNERGPHLWMYDANTVLRLSAVVDDGGAHVRTLDAFGKELPAQK